MAGLKRQIWFLIPVIIILFAAGCSGGERPSRDSKDPPAVVEELKTYENPAFRVSLKYPGNWQPNPGYGMLGSLPGRYEGEDGFFSINAIDGESMGMDEVAGLSAGHRLKPFGENPAIEKAVLNGIEARFVFPSPDQPADMKNAACLIVRYPEAVVIGGHNYNYFELLADKGHIREIARSLAFEPAPTAPDGRIGLIFRYGVGAKNDLNTFKGSYTRDMIVDPPVTVKMALSEKDLESIYGKMKEIDFFSYPGRFKVSPTPEEGLMLVTPHDSYYFLVVHEGGTKELWWDDEIKNKNEKADRLRDLIKHIQKIIESKSEYKKLPQPRGAYV